MKKGKISNIKILSIISMLSIPLVASFSIVPIFINTNYSQSRENFFTTYDNALDNSIALGIAPDYDTSSFAGKVPYSEYLNDFVDNNITKYKNISIMDGQEVNRLPIEFLKIQTIVLNEWMKSDEYKFNNIVNNIAYTSMGDSSAATYNENMNSGGWNYKTQVSIDNAFLMQANEMDNIYVGRNFKNKAQKIIELDKQRIRELNTNYKSVFQNLSIGIIRGSNLDYEVDTNFYFISPGVYPFLYENNNPEKGIGIQFPEPKERFFLNETNYKSHRIQSSQSSQLLYQFEGKFDYLIYLGPDIGTDEKYEEIVKNSKIKFMLRNPEKNNTNIKVAKTGKWYTSAWGIIGKRQILNYLKEFLNINGHKIVENKLLIWDVPKKLERLRKVKA